VRNPAAVRRSDQEGYPHRDYIDFVDNLLDPNTGTMTGRALLPNPEGVLTPSLFARVCVPGRGVKQALLVSDAANGSDQAEIYLIIIDGKIGRPRNHD
jgi:multidrug efflux pump subunit AcrA (membrane-fusion protein)